MITGRDAERLMVLTVACTVLFVVCCNVAYAQRGYLAVGGEYIIPLIPMVALAVTVVSGGGDR